MKLVYTFAVLLSILLLCGLGSCNKQPNGGIPYYVNIDTSYFAPGPTQGANTAAITDAWVEVNSTNLGAYELPTRFPVLIAGQSRFVISAGIWESGQPQTRVTYPFYNPDTFTINYPVNDSQYYHIPKYTYKGGIVFPFPPEDFSSYPYDDTMQHYVDSNPKYGNCGRLTVTIQDSDITTTQKLLNPYPLDLGQEIWLEMDYRSDVPFWVGFKSYYTNAATLTTPVFFGLPTNNWTHIYIKFSALVAQTNATLGYYIYFEAINPTGGTGGSLYVDNVKMLMF